jgi:hypothetical protein
MNWENFLLHHFFINSFQVWKLSHYQSQSLIQESADIFLQLIWKRINEMTNHFLKFWRFGGKSTNSFFCVFPFNGIDSKLQDLHSIGKSTFKFKWIFSTTFLVGSPFRHFKFVIQLQDHLVRNGENQKNSNKITIPIYTLKETNFKGLI